MNTVIYNFLNSQIIIDIYACAFLNSDINHSALFCISYNSLKEGIVLPIEIPSYYFTISFLNAKWSLRRGVILMKLFKNNDQFSFPFLLNWSVWRTVLLAFWWLTYKYDINTVRRRAKCFDSSMRTKCP